MPQSVKRYCPGQSVGAIIRNKKGDFLCLFRLKKPIGLALPAGHIEKGETPEQAIKREVLEETGLMVDKADLIWRGFIENECSLKDENGFYYNAHQWWIYDISEWRGQPRLQEPGKHKFVKFMPLNKRMMKKLKGQPVFDPAWLNILKTLNIF
ncbi:MAG: NUDIX hydrolase [Candidatus Brennerbacteria bacterium]|nr:NUDIX hydrolase [Candidatus Brennerbacteria bacterium]